MFSNIRLYPFRFMLYLLLLAVGIASCSRTTPVSPTATIEVISITDTQTAVPTATFTPVPAAAIVNGEIIPLAEFNAELQRYQAGVTEGTLNEAEIRQVVLAEMIHNLLLAQAAYNRGYVDDAALLEARINDIRSAREQKEGFAAWLAANYYTEESFAAALKQAMAAAWMRDQIAAEVPLTAEQIHARQILVYDEAYANTLFARLQSGVEFATLAYQVDPLTGGELGWFPRGYLTVPLVEEAAFSLQPGQYSPVIKTDLGFHILYIMERESDRALDPDAYLILQRLHIEDWLAVQFQKAQIVNLLP